MELVWNYRNTSVLSTLIISSPGHIVAGHNLLDAHLDNLHIVASKGFNYSMYQVG